MSINFIIRNERTGLVVAQDDETLLSEGDPKDRLILKNAQGKECPQSLWFAAYDPSRHSWLRNIVFFLFQSSFFIQVGTVYVNTKSLVKRVSLCLEIEPFLSNDLLLALLRVADLYGPFSTSLFKGGKLKSLISSSKEDSDPIRSVLWRDQIEGELEGILFPFLHPPTSPTNS